MTDPTDALVLDLLEWIGDGSRRYEDVMDAWRTSCPRLPVWEEANERGFVGRELAPDGALAVTLTPRGRDHLMRCRRHPHVVRTDHG
jgi:D-3-phosphoglycerate dehydrogenase